MSTSIFFLGLTFIVIGAGFFKTSASVMVGMLHKNKMIQVAVLAIQFFI
ncbi:hypothetical protein [Campylobacter jejuni]|nr:hypothetical protein [Campylobacter jejuni]